MTDNFGVIEHMIEHAARKIIGDPEGSRNLVVGFLEEIKQGNIKNAIKFSHKQAELGLEKANSSEFEMIMNFCKQAKRFVEILDQTNVLTIEIVNHMEEINNTINKGTSEITKALYEFWNVLLNFVKQLVGSSEERQNGNINLIRDAARKLIDINHGKPTKCNKNKT